MNTEIKKHKIVTRRFLWWVYQDVYIDANTRISYGFHSQEASNSYILQRKTNHGWKRKAWTYFGGTVESIYEYLLYKEESDRNKKGQVSAFKNAYF